MERRGSAEHLGQGYFESVAICRPCVVYTVLEQSVLHGVSVGRCKTAAPCSSVRISLRIPNSLSKRRRVSLCCLSCQSVLCPCWSGQKKKEKVDQVDFLVSSRFELEISEVRVCITSHSATRAV